MQTISHDECWLWAGSFNKDGYGIICANSKVYRAHRVMYENKVGELNSELVTDHLCRVRACINPDHIEAVTQLVNKMRGLAPAALNARKTKCNKGHEFTKENTLVRKNGWRICRTCKKDWEKQYKKRRRQRS